MRKEVIVFNGEEKKNLSSYIRLSKSDKWTIPKFKCKVKTRENVTVFMKNQFYTSDFI